MLYSSSNRHNLDTPVLCETDSFIVKLAETDDELRKAFKLRYRVFNIEQGKGLASAEATGLDSDEFDPQCLHMIVFDKSNDLVIGTYRINFGRTALRAEGFYSAREYLIEGISDIADETIEVGRSCVDPDYRQGVVVGLLWQGLSVLLMRSGSRYLLGCVSLETINPADGWGLYEYFRRRGLITDVISAEPMERFKLERPNDVAVCSDVDAKELIPPLFKGYLRIGTLICGPPALDYEFGTIDYLILHDMHKMPERYCRRFGYVRDDG